MEPAQDTLVASSDKTPEPAGDTPQPTMEQESVVQETPTAQRFQNDPISSNYGYVIEIQHPDGSLTYRWGGGRGLADYSLAQPVPAEQPSAMTERNGIVPSGVENDNADEIARIEKEEASMNPAPLLLCTLMRLLTFPE